MTPLVEIRDLSVGFGDARVLHGIDLTIRPGEALGLVGESGCGKSVTWLAALGLLPAHAKVTGSVRLEGREIANAPRPVLEDIRGGRIAMIFQDPASALNPVIRVGRQICEALRLHQNMKGASARAEAIRLMNQVGIPDATNRFSRYPHEFSGGQCQRLMIAMALAGKPNLLIADEPTTALDATIQAQILELLGQLRRETGMALVFISHDLGAVAEISDRVAVMYAGRIVEEGIVADLFSKPLHPYTRGLFDAIPRMDGPPAIPSPIPGGVPDPHALPPGCAFSPRCAKAISSCTQERPALVSNISGRKVACFFPMTPDAPAASLNGAC